MSLSKDVGDGHLTWPIHKHQHMQKEVQEFRTNPCMSISKWDRKKLGFSREGAPCDQKHESTCSGGSRLHLLVCY